MGWASLQGCAVNRTAKEVLLGQRGRAVWLFGLSGSGKSTLATTLESRLVAEGLAAVLLDGDQLRSGLNRGLGFSHADRTENIRRAAEVARLFVQNGTIAICAFITPCRAQRALVRDIVGEADVTFVYLNASVETCARRDPKGLYRKARAGEIAQFTGVGADFEPSAPDESALVLDTEREPVVVSAERLFTAVRTSVALT